MRVLLASTYELGHQPLHVASPAAALGHAGHEVRCVDLSVERWDAGALAWADAVAFSVPMHTAMRLALRAAAGVRRDRPSLPVCLYGLYATVTGGRTGGALADLAVAGEYEPALVAWADGLEPAGHEGRPAEVGASGPPPSGGVVVALGRSPRRRPARHLLPPLDRYAHLAIGDEERLVGYVEASHGCSHRCLHCPVPAVYDGRTRVVDQDVVLADVEQQVAMGARHVTFGDPDFLNRPLHALRVVRAVHQRFPDTTFDCTVKVEHVLRHRGVWAELAGAGCLFVVSALECVNDAVLARLDKGHTAAEAAEAVVLLRHHGIELRPSFLPFTPWTTLDDLVDILDFVIEHDLVGNVDPVQFTIRLLVPEGSLLARRPELIQLGPYDPERLTYTWAAQDPRLDQLQSELSALVEAAVAAGEVAESIFLDVNAMVRAAAGRPGQAGVGVGGNGPLIATGAVTGRPRLTEPWFC